MAKMSDTRSAPDVPEFHIVVRRPNARGPIGPYRLTIAVLFALFVAGRDLYDAAMTGTNYDGALIHAGMAALFIWVLSGVVNSILRTSGPPDRSPTATD